MELFAKIINGFEPINGTEPKYHFILLVDIRL